MILQTALIASSKTVLSPFWVSAEHSRYFTAPMSRPMATPCEYVMGAIRLKHVSKLVKVDVLLTLTGPSVSQSSAGLREDQAWCLPARFEWMEHDV